MAAEKKKQNRNMLDEKSGFHVVVNFYIMRYIYSHMTGKHVTFRNDRGDTTKRESYIDFSVIVNTTRQRLNRMFQGYSFEMSSSRIQELVYQFGLSEDYFNGKANSIQKAKYIEIDSLSLDDWKCFFNYKYTLLKERKKRKSAGENITDKDIKQLRNVFYIMGKDADKIERAKVVEKKLEDIFKNGWLNSRYDENTDVYKVYYYFKYNRKYGSKGVLENFKKTINSLKLSEWDAIEDQPKEMEEFIKRLEEHLEYIKTIKRYHEIKKIERK